MKLPVVSGPEIIKALERNGFVRVGQKGSHVKLRQTHSPSGVLTVIVPLHKTLKRGTLKAILRQSGLGLADIQ
ncbi:MAG: type II toxin-antitoxin system HicA family toxin [Patescibacteria group bacterium]